MTTIKRNRLPEMNKQILVVLWIILLGGCSPLISIFDETAYKNGIDLKVDFQFLIESSVKPFDQHQDQIDDFRKKLYKAYEHEKGRDKNNLTIEQYKILISDDGPILGYFKVWKKNNQVSEYFKKQAMEQSAAIFDELLQLEHAKRREGIKLKLTNPDSQQTKE